MSQTYCPYCMTPVKPGEPCPVCGLTEGSYHPQPHHLPPGTMLADRYMLGRVLGEGGFGITYIGCDTRLELRVAVKEYFPGSHVARNCAASPAVTCYDGVAGRGFEKGRERFIREARTMAKMDKTPQIVAVRDFFQENNTAYIVMEYVEGTTFKELVTQKGGGMSAGELLPMLRPLFGALETMHSQGLIHRDISPDNLMLENGMVRLLDFGCAREADKGGSETMTIVLKQGYSPVEQYQHKGQGPWTDVYSLAATMYYCLTGKTPPQALDRICDDELIPPRKLGADLTREQELALLYGMGLQPTRRFRSVQEFYAALYQGAPVPEVPVPIPPDRQEWGNSARMPPEHGAEALQSRELAEEPAEERPGPAADREAETVPPAGAGETEDAPPGDAAKEPRSGEPDGPARERTEKPDRKKPVLIGGAVAAAALIIALVVVIPKLMGPGDPAADGSQPPEVPEPPEVSVEPLPGDLFDGAAQATDRGLIELLNDDSVPAVVIPRGHELRIDSGEAVEIAKPLRLEPNAALYVSGPLTVSSTVQLSVGARIDQDTDFALTGDGALYIEPSAYVHVGNSGSGNCDIAGTVQIARDCEFWSSGEAVSLSGTVLSEGGCGFNGKTAVSGAILVTGNSNTWFNGETDVTGTVRVADGCNIWFNNFTTVSGEGWISVDGYIYSGHVFKTADGGGAAAGGAGRMEFNVLWLEKAADLNAPGDHIGLDQSRYIVADEDGPFENAAHVNSFRELEQAVNDRLASAIVIDSGFEMDYALTINKPVLISEGAELNFDDRGMLIFTDMTVNYGRVTGHMQLNGQCVYLNYGGTDADIFANDGNNYLLNMGELNLQYGQHIGSTIVNLGRMRHENYGGEDTNFLDLVGAMVENLGEFTVASGSNMKLCGGGYFENRGELIIEENARLENSTHIGAGGLIRVRGDFDNTGGILQIDHRDCLSMEGGRVEGGVIQTVSQMLFLENIDSPELVLRNEPSFTVEVSSADELMTALTGNSGAIRVTGDVTVDGNLSLECVLIIDSGARLRAADLTTSRTVYVHGELEANELTIRGEGGQLRLEGDGSINTNILTLEDCDGVIWGGLTADSVRLTGSGLINWGMLRCGDLILDDEERHGCYFYNRGGLAENVNIAVNSGTFADLNWLEMPSGSITVGSEGRMLLRGGARLYDGVAVTNRGALDALWCEFWLDGGAFIVNYGELRFNHWAWQNVVFEGEVTNRGYMYLNGAERVEGLLTNYGELEIGNEVIQIGGQLNNYGTAHAYNRDAGYQGDWRGNALEYR